MVNSIDFGKRIKKIMKFHDLNASSFAEKIEVGRSSISHILSGRNKPSLDLVMQIVHTFPEVDLYWLLNGKGSYPTIQQSESKNQDVSSPSKKLTSQASLNVNDTDHPSTAPTLFNVVNNTQDPNLNNNSLGKKVSKIIVLYDDGTFKDYLPE